MIVRIIIGVRLPCVVVSTDPVMLDVDDSSLGGGGGATTPGECNVPASAEIESVKLRAMTAPVRSSLFTCWCLLSD